MLLQYGISSINFFLSFSQSLLSSYSINVGTIQCIYISFEQIPGTVSFNNDGHCTLISKFPDHQLKHGFGRWSCNPEVPSSRPSSLLWHQLDFYIHSRQSLVQLFDHAIQEFSYEIVFQMIGALSTLYTPTNITLNKFSEGKITFMSAIFNSNAMTGCIIWWTNFTRSVVGCKV